MPYTLSMGLFWVLAAVALGVVIGWLMRSVVAQRQIERARTNHLDHVELERLRSRVGELEPLAELGRTVRTDDLTMIEGVTGSVADLCRGIGIHTWNDLAATDVSLLRTMLQDAGPRFRTLDPTTWPEQAALLVAGRWEEYRALAGRAGAPDAGTDG